MFINVKPSAMYVYVCLDPVVVSTYVFGHGGQTDLFLFSNVSDTNNNNYF